MSLLGSLPSNKTERAGFTGFCNSAYPSQMGSLKQIESQVLARNRDGGAAIWKKYISRLGKILHNNK